MNDGATDSFWFRLQIAGSALASRSGVGNPFMATPSNEAERIHLDARAAMFAIRAEAAITAFLEASDKQATAEQLLVDIRKSLSDQ